MNDAIPLTRDLVLIGGGHTHALVLRKWGMTRLPGARVTVINPGPVAAYSGMLPGFVAGPYTRDALDIDIVRLARFAGARLILGAAEGIDLVARTVQVPGRPPVAFDVLSVDIGITSDMPSLPGFADHAIPAKPLGPFADRWAEYRDATGPASVVVIGGGVAGAELAMAMAHALRTRDRPAQVHLIDRGVVLKELPVGPRRRMLDALRGSGVLVAERADVRRVAAGGVVLADGRHIAADFVTGAAGARPYDWLEQTGLKLEHGFIRIDDKLRSSDPSVFAAGDCAHMAFAPRPKAGVYAVRQAPVLFANLRAALAGTPWKTYSPQRDYLKLISLGDKRALAEKRGVPVSGKLMWRWKDRIDQSFMDKFRGLAPMTPPALPPVRAKGGAPQAMLCTGCGAKVGRDALRTALEGLPKVSAAVQSLPGDDAAVLWIGGKRQVLTTDHLSAVCEDPALMARVAAVHALGDIWAMGAQPQTALAQIVMPRMSPALQARTLREIMQVAGEVMAQAGAEIVGGHSTLGAGLSIGFSLTGLCPRVPLTLAGALPGDAIVLTKPIGTGVLLAAEMAGRARGQDIARLYARMVVEQGTAATILAGAHAMTDVTGFGLAGHLQGICDASGTGAEIWLNDVPLLAGAEALSLSGIRSTLYDDNRALVPGLPDAGRAALLFDPQTCGGLLACVASDGADAVSEALRAAGYRAAIIGRVTDQPGVLSLRH